MHDDNKDKTFSHFPFRVKRGRLHDHFTDGMHAIDQALVLYKALSKTTCVKEEGRGRSMDEDDGVEASTLPPMKLKQYIIGVCVSEICCIRRGL